MTVVILTRRCSTALRILSRTKGTHRALGSTATATNRFAALQQHSSRRDGKVSSSSSWTSVTVGSALVAVSGLVLYATSTSTEPLSVAHCEEASTPAMKTTTTTTTSEPYHVAPNPVWPAGVREADMDALVQDCLDDPTINIPTVPDYLERQIYRSTIKLTLNALYQTLGDLHGMDILGHELRIERLSDHEAGVDTFTREFRLAQMRGSVAEAVLDKVVDGLLDNKAVNQPLIPDVVERQLYKNCLVIIFRVLDMMAATFSITCCGHDLRFTVEPSQNAVVTDAAVQQATRIDPQLMLEYARQMGLQPEKEVNQNRSWWDRFFRPTQDEVLAQLHATLYSLVLGILDDVLAHTNIRLLSDSLQFDLVPVPFEVQEARRRAAAAAIGKVEESSEDDASSLTPSAEPSAALAFATFTAGLGVGITLMSLLGKR